jgi:hypothetical protein
MKRISKLLSVVLAVVLTLAVIPVSSLTASAVIHAPEIKLIPSKAAAQIGEVITVSVTVPKNSRFCGLTLDIVYNKSHFELIEATSKYEFDVDMLNPTHTNSTIRFVGTDTTYIDDDATTLFTMKFKVRNNCRELYAVVKEAYIVDADGKNLDVTMDANILSLPITIHQSGDENLILAPTCIETGYKTYNCPCGEFVEEFTPAVGHNYENRVCVVCGETAPDEVVTVAIREPSMTEIRSKDGIVLHAVVQGDTSGTTVVWTASNDKYFKTEVSGNDLTIISHRKGYTTFTASVYDSHGVVVSSASVEMYSKAGFFDRIGGFFRDLFGTNVIHKY